MAPSGFCPRYGSIKIGQPGPDHGASGGWGGMSFGYSCRYDHIGVMPRLAIVYCCTAYPICRSCDMHLSVFADSRTLCNTGSSIAMSTPMMPITTSNSIRLKPAERSDVVEDRMPVMQSPNPFVDY